MTATISSSTTTPRSGTGSARRQRRIWAATTLTGLVAAAVTTLIAAVAKAAGAGLDVDGEAIPTLGFAQLTLVGAVMGGVLASVLTGWARRPRRTFVAITIVLTLLSLVPDMTMAIDRVSAAVLIATHLVAAAIVVPALARRLASGG